MTLDGKAILLHGGAIALAASALILLALRLNPRLFLKHFPRKVIEAQPPLSRAETAAGYWLALPLFLVLVGGPIASTLIVAGGKGTPQDPLSLWVHAFLVGMVFNLFDWIVLDEGLLGIGTPRWALPPGVTLEDVTPFEHGRHFADFLKGVIFCAVVALIASGAAIAAAALGWSGGSEL